MSQSNNCDRSIWYKKLEPQFICQQGEDVEKDYWLDILLMIILILILPVLLKFIRRTFSHVEMRNIHNYIIYSSLFICIILRTACLAYSLTIDNNKFVPDDSIQFYIYY